MSVFQTNKDFKNILTEIYTWFFPIYNFKLNLIPKPTFQRLINVFSGKWITFADAALCWFLKQDQYWKQKYLIASRVKEEKLRPDSRQLDWSSLGRYRRWSSEPLSCISSNTCLWKDISTNRNKNNNFMNSIPLFEAPKKSEHKPGYRYVTYTTAYVICAVFFPVTSCKSL